MRSGPVHSSPQSRREVLEDVMGLFETFSIAIIATSSMFPAAYSPRLGSARLRKAVL
jgi:hypothetical protein